MSDGRRNIQRTLGADRVAICRWRVVVRVLGSVRWGRREKLLLWGIESSGSEKFLDALTGGGFPRSCNEPCDGRGVRLGQSSSLGAGAPVFDL